MASPPIMPGGAMVGRPMLLPAIAVSAALAVAFLALDRLPRFYQGDSLAYFTTGLSGWVPPDRSWAYGFATRWLVEGLGSISVLVAAQAGLLLGAVLLLCRAMPSGPGAGWAIPAFAAAAALDPLNEALARFWLSDTVGAAAFLAFAGLLARGIGAPAGRFRRVVPWLAAVGVLAVFVRVAYAPVMAGLLVGITGVASLYPVRSRPPRLRRRMLALLGVPLAGVAMLALANSVVAIPSLRGQVFVNRMSDLYTLGVFLPGVQYQDFADAGVPITEGEFDRLDRSLDAREAQVWRDGPGHLRWTMMQHMGVTDPYEARFQAACAAVLRAVLRRHPQDLAWVYVRSLAASLDPGRWQAVMASELGRDKPLPDWAAAHLSAVSGRPVPSGITLQPSLLTRWVEAGAGAYPLLLMAGAAAAVWMLALARPFGAQHVLALALLSSLLAAPLYSHAVKPRYVLATVLLSYLLLLQAAAQPVVLRALRAFVRSPALPAAASLACVAAFAGLLGLGRWQTDEFRLVATLLEGGVGTTLQRVGVSPRPLSEGLLAAYAVAVNALQRPLIQVVLGLLWAAAGAATAGAAWAVLVPARGRALAALALAASLLAFVLASAEVTEVFFWPMAAAPYLPTAGAASAAAVLLAAPGTPARRVGCCVALLAAACSSEMGAALAVGVAGASVLDAMTRSGGPRGMALVRQGWWWIAPGMAGAVFLATVVLFRHGMVELGSDTQPYTGRLLPSLGLALRQLVLDLVGGGLLPVPIALGAKLAFAVGFASVWRLADRGAPVPVRGVAVAVAGLAASAGFSVLAASYHYGNVCCERHATTRYWLSLLALVLGARAVLAFWPAAARLLDKRAWLPPALLAASLLPVLGRVDGLRAGYDVQHLAHDGRARTWRSGLQPDTAQMEFYLPPDGEGLPVRGTFQPIRRWDIDAGASPDVPEMLREAARYFRKTVLFTCQPWQNEKSWLLNGQFIPACPPHDGPPDIVYPPP